MAVFKLGAPEDLTGNNDNDMQMMHSYMCNMQSQLNYVLGHIDSDNLSEDILNNLGIKEE